MGIRHAKPYTLRGGPLTKLEQRLFKAWQLSNHPKNPSISLKTDRAHICTISNVRVWVKLHGVPLTAFSEDCLSGLSSYVRAMIELRVDMEFKDTIMEAMHKLNSEEFYLCSNVAKNLNNPNQATRGVLVDPKVGFKPVKQVYRHVSKEKRASTSGNKKKDAESRKELERLITDGKLTLVDDDKPIENVDYLGNHNSEDEVEPVENEMASFLASNPSGVGYGTNSLLKQWRETYGNADYDYDPYDDDMYEGQEIPDNI
ncbi:hypothetical protein Tco_0170084 [Tanacetum coccineum]